MFRFKRSIDDTKKPIQDATVSSSDDVMQSDAPASTEGGHKGGASGESIDSARRYISYSTGSQTLSFFKTHFGTITTKLSGFPHQHSIASLFSTQDLARIKSFLGTNSGFNYVSIKTYPTIIKNIIVLSDDIRTVGSSVTEVSSFVQNCKVMHFSIAQDKGYNDLMYTFNIGDITDSITQHDKDIVHESNKKISEHNKKNPTKKQRHIIVQPKSVVAKFIGFPKAAFVAQDDVKQKLLWEMPEYSGSDYDLNEISYRPFKSFPSEYTKQIWSRTDTPNYQWWKLDSKNNPYGYAPLRTSTNANQAGWQLQTMVKDSWKDYEKLQSPLLKNHPYEHIDAGTQVTMPTPHYPNVLTEKENIYNQLMGGTITITDGAATPSDLTIPTYVVPPSKFNQVKTPFDLDEMSITQKAARNKHFHTHDYLIMVPIKTSQDTTMKIRANVTVETRVDITFLTSEVNSMTGGAADNMSNQLNVSQYNLNMREQDTDIGVFMFMR